MMGVPALIVAAALLTAPGAQEAPSRDEPEASAKKVIELRQERIATLKDMVEIGVKLYSTGRGEIPYLLDARMALLKAEADAAETESDRIALYKESVETLKQYEAMARAAKEAARGTELDILAVKEKRLEVEIWLELAETKAAK